MTSLPRSLFAMLAPTGILFFLHRLRIFLVPWDGRFDPFLHFFGGMSIAWLTWRGYRLLRERAAFPELPRWAVTLICIAVTALVGVLWEFYEYAVFIWLDPTYDIRLPDTMFDLLLDLAGGSLFASFVFVRSALEKRFR